MKRRPLPLLVPALILAACNSGPVTAQQTNQSAQNNSVRPGDNAAAPSAAPGSIWVIGCHFSGWSSDLDPNGLNVRAGPSANARIVGTLPPPETHPDNETLFGVTFDVVGTRDGWFLIENARRWSDAGRGPSTLPSGWISGRYLAFQLQTDKVFAAPSPNAPVLLASWDDNGTLTQFRYRHPTDCNGEWVRLTAIGPDGRERQGWVRGICGIQETTCDGVHGDLLEEGEARGWTAMD
jgi:hypothetical protein